MKVERAIIKERKKMKEKTYICRYRKKNKKPNR